MKSRMKYFLAAVFFGILAVVTAFACGPVFPTNVNGIVWQDCGGTVVVGNNGPLYVQVDFSVVYQTGGTPGEWAVNIPPYSFIAEPIAAPVANVYVNSIQ